MKNRPPLRSRPSRTRSGWLFVGLLWALGPLGVAACSSSAPEESSSVEPLAAPAAAGGEQDEDPDATETNFITPACVSDADCRGEDRCIFSPQPDAGAASGADAGVRLGSCKVPREP